MITFNTTVIILMNMVNFFVSLDDIFDELINSNPEYFNKDILNMKSKIIQAYQSEKNTRGEYIASILRVKHFHIDDEGKIVSH